ncbi:MAG: hypothetical protein ACXWBO_15480 [Ilumatobacteraceae bacterium]
MTISIVDFDHVGHDDPADSYWAVIERISLASKTYTNENAGALHLASTLRQANAVSRDDAAERDCWPQTG